MSDSLSVGLIGTGGISRLAHIPAWNELDGATVTAIAEPDADNRAAAADAVTADVERHADYEPLLDAADLDLVDVTIPPGDAKADAIRTALRQGVHVTCQKPFAEDLETAADLVATAEREGVGLSVNQQARFAGAFQRGREHVEEGRLGDLRTIQVRSDFLLSGSHHWLHYSVHTYDLVRYWAGVEPERVMAWFPRQTEDGRHVLAAWLDFGDGLVATVWDEFSSSTNLRWGFRLMGDGGSIRGHEEFGEMIPARTAHTPAGELSETVEPVAETYVPDAFRGYFVALVDALRAGDPVPVSGRDNLETLRIAFAVERSFEHGRWVDLDDMGADE